MASGDGTGAGTGAPAVTKHAGSCHCGAVRFEVELDLGDAVNRCNCAWCLKSGTANAIVKPDAFRITAGEATLVDYQRPGQPKHAPFCARCGIHAFTHGNIPELGGEVVSVNVNCLDDVDPTRLRYLHWDGRHDNWHAGPRGEPWPVQP